MDLRAYFEIIIPVLVLFLFIFNKYNLYEGFLFLGAFTTIGFYIGVYVPFSQIVLLFISIYLFLKNKFFSFFNKSVFFFLIYIFIIGFVITNFFITNFKFVSYGGFFQNEGRYITQVIYYFILFLNFYVSRYYIKSKSNVLSAINALFDGIIIVSLLALFQYLIFQLYGYDIFPIHRLGGKVGSYQQYIGENKYFRICSLAGEPKSLGMFSLLGLILMIILKNYNKKVKYLTIKLSILLFAYLFSFSSSAYIITPVLLFVYFIVRFFIIRKVYLTSFFIRYLIVIIFSLVLIGPFLINIINVRVYERIEKQGAVEDFDDTIIQYIKHNPKYLVFGTGVGNVHQFAGKYISFEHKYYMANSIYVAKSALLRIISETGFIGLILFISIFINTMYVLYKTAYYNNIQSLLFLLLILITVFYFIRGYMFFYFFSITALCNSFVRNKLYINYKLTQIPK